MSDPLDLYRHARAAQARAERSGFPGTAAALAAIAEMIAQQVEVRPDQGLADPHGSSSPAVEGLLPLPPHLA